MTRHTIDFGIDLGTTNSAAAVMTGGNAQVLRNNINEEITPSAVQITETKAIVVGRAAYQNLRLNGNRNSFDQFKPDMGKVGKNYVFADAGLSMSAEELATEVLKSLRGDAEAWAGEPVNQAVITVPAAFELAQSEATTRAAANAGIDHSPLLQEPIAAGLAHGYDQQLDDCYFAVYDLGGGTFDVSLLRIEGNELSVIGHDGDNHLGGRDWDRYLAAIFAERLEDLGFNLDFVESDRSLEHKRLIATIAEDEKKRLSRSEAVEVVLDGTMTDAAGRDIKASFEVTRADLVSLIQLDVARTIGLTEELLDRNAVPRDQIKSIILAGGPTLTPHVREALKTLGVPLETRVDPMTVVARGAAVFAAGQQAVSQTTPQRQSPAGAIETTFAYEGVSKQANTTVGGKFSPAELVTHVELVRSDGGWASGRVQVDGGTFIVPVALETNQTNVFEVLAFDATGGRQSLTADRIAITHGLTAAAPPLSRTLSVVALDSNDGEMLEAILLKGTPLPAVRQKSFRTATELKPGDLTTMLDIHVVEGESPSAENNRHVGFLRISGEALSDPLPAGTPIEVKIRVDQSRGIVASAFIPLIDLSQEDVLMDKYVPEVDAKTVENSLAETLELARSVAAGRDDDLARIEADGSEISRDLETTDAVDRAERRLKELRDEVDRLAAETALDRALDALVEERAETSEFVSNLGTEQEKAELIALEADCDRTASSRDLARITRATADLYNLYMRVMVGQPSFWVDHFITLAQTVQESSRSSQLAPLVEDGRRALDSQDLDALRAICRELWDQLPEEDQASSGLPNIGIRT